MQSHGYVTVILLSIKKYLCNYVGNVFIERRVYILISYHDIFNADIKLEKISMPYCARVNDMLTVRKLVPLTLQIYNIIHIKKILNLSLIIGFFNLLLVISWYFFQVYVTLGYIQNTYNNTLK